MSLAAASRIARRELRGGLRGFRVFLACLILGSVVSYSKARAEGLGMTANVGIAERADRLVAVLVATGLTGLFGLPTVVLGVVLALLALASLVTVVQRILTVRRQALGAT